MRYEVLEPRRLFSASAVSAIYIAATRTLLINGTAGNDTIAVFQEGDAVFAAGSDGNGDFVQLTPEAGLTNVSNILIASGDGNDEVSVFLTGIDASVFAGNGDDLLNIFADSGSQVIVDSAAGADGVFVDAGGGALVIASTGAGDDYGHAYATGAAKIYVSTGSGNDGTDLGFALQAAGGGSLVSFDGGSDDDRIVIESVTGGGTVYAEGASGNDWFIIDNVDSTSQVVVTGGNGDDTFQVYSSSTQYSGGTIRVNGGPGSDTLTAEFNPDGTLIVKKVESTIGL